MLIKTSENAWLRVESLKKKGPHNLPLIRKWERIARKLESEGK